MSAALKCTPHHSRRGMVSCYGMLARWQGQAISPKSSGFPSCLMEPNSWYKATSCAGTSSLTRRHPITEGYDLICIHPDPHRSVRQIRVQVKSRYATNADRGFPVKERTFSAFDFLVAAFLNIGNFGTKGECRAGLREPEFYTLPVDLIRLKHDKTSSWEKFKLGKLDLEPFRNERGFELIADALGIDYPVRESQRST